LRVNTTRPLPDLPIASGANCRTETPLRPDRQTAGS
jgi:hypothetical protein